MTAKKFNPFYCYKKQCRKTAWDTPEYLVPTDFEFVAGLLPFLESGDKAGARNYLFPLIANSEERMAHEKIVQDFFYHVIGCPELRGYCQHIDMFCNDMEKTYFYLTGFRALEKFIPEFKKMLEKSCVS